MTKRAGLLLNSAILFLFVFLSPGYVKAEDLKIESIELKSSNWEALGSYLEIKGDGRYIAYTVRAGREEGERKAGRIDPARMSELIRYIESADFYAFKEEYRFPPYSRQGTNIELTIVSDKGIKRIRFYLHNDGSQEAVPQGLIGITERIYHSINMSKSQRLSYENI
ncbi:hypothetical protein [Candidatus Velamenicoccus archaeovorus]|uniref:hypothetical protein n=1 Tax=Velamenicoccus archaeovorus TaxID=1930593 RepID=UPI000FFF4494|nr:hypothetical protein [Candidatus Velamenicoccus archaeovorus]